MPKQIDYRLSKDERERLEEAIKFNSDPRVSRRATAMRMLHLGKKPAEVAELLNVSQGTIYNWHTRWREDELAGLRDAPRSGRPPLATEAYCAELEGVLETDPTSLGYGFTLWTIDRLRAHLAQETGIEMSDETFRKVLSDNDYVYRRPKHDLKPLQDREARASAEDLLDTLKKRPKPAKSNYSLWTKPA